MLIATLLTSFVACSVVCAFFYKTDARLVVTILFPTLYVLTLFLKQRASEREQNNLLKSNPSKLAIKVHIGISVNGVGT